MSRSPNILTIRQIATVETPGRYADGGGLYLEIAAAGSRSWLFASEYLGRPTEVRLGDTSSVSLTMARRLAVAMRYAIASGQDPRAVLGDDVADEKKSIPTFGAFMTSYINSVEGGWKTPRYHEVWRSSLHTYAAPLLAMPIDQIGTEEVMAVLKPIWPRLPQTANKVRGRIEKVLDAAEASGLRVKGAINPAAWRGHLMEILPTPSRLVNGHYSALPWRAAPTFIAELRSRQALAARCLELVILTAARKGEGLGLKWGEIDWESNLWSIPANRTTSGVENVVSLSTTAIALLSELRPDNWHPDARVFSVGDKPISDRAIAMLLKRMKFKSITTHGFRYSFKEWAAEDTDFPVELVDQVLAGGVINAAQYGESGASIDLRRQLMESWSKFLGLRNT